MLLSSFEQKCVPQKNLWPFIKKMDIWFLSGGISGNGGIVVTENIELLRHEFMMRVIELFNRDTERALQASYAVTVKSFQAPFGGDDFEFYPILRVTVRNITYNYVIDRMVTTSGLVLFNEDCLRFFYDDEFNPTIISEQARKHRNKCGRMLNPYVQEECRLRDKI